MVEELEEIENKMQTTPKPAEITEHFEIDSKDKFIEFMTTPKYHESNWKINLKCNIDMEGAALEPIDEYKGKFNGNGHIVSNMAFIRCCFAEENYGTISGISFVNCQQVEVTSGFVASGFVIRNNKDGIINNCFIENDILNRRFSAVIFVVINKGKITNCKAKGEVTGDYTSGGFVGENEGTITNCTAEGEVTGDYGSGGFVGENEGTITSCTAKCNVNVNGDNGVGGFVAYNNGHITKCRSSGKVNGKDKVGGFIGENYRGEITDCKAKGEVTGKDYVGGFIGCNREFGTIKNCTEEGEVKGNNYVGGFVGESGDMFSGISTIVEITNCKAKGKVTGKYTVGGFAGNNESKGIITNCTAEGEVCSGILDLQHIGETIPNFV
ncbi:MAG: hypothetical protein K2G97_04930 [Oscillospiraceae bacterium]|nr:hypothetical protein [Oscillospiraceae bacterium]